MRIAEASKLSQIRLIDNAQQPIDPITPNKGKNLIISTFLGLALGIALAFTMNILDSSLRSQQDVEDHINLPVLTSIPMISTSGTAKSIVAGKHYPRSYSEKLLYQLQGGSHIYEAYRTLQVKFAFVNSKSMLKSILVTSASPAEGKTLTAINISQAFAKSGIKTLLIDCDLRRPMIHKILGINQTPGLSEALNNKIEWQGHVASDWVVEMPENKNLFVLPSGVIPPNPYEMLTSPQMRSLLAEFERTYDLVILDSPPLMAVTDSVVLGNAVDGVCLVIKSGITSRDEALRAKQLLDNGQTNVIGTILNGTNVKNNPGYYKNSYYLN